MRRALWLLSSAALLFGAPKSDRPFQERFLETAHIVRVVPLSEGVTHSKRATLEEAGFRHDAQIQQVDIYKAEYRTKSGVEKNFSDSYKYNIAAYLLDKLLDLNMTPVSVGRDYEGKPSAFTWWIDDVVMSEKERRAKNLAPPDPERWNSQFNSVYVFDQLIYNVDRTQENILIGRDWKIWMIDHTRSFRTSHELRDPRKLTRCDHKLFEGLRRLDPAAVRRTLSPYLHPDQVQALLARRELIVAFFEKEIAAKGRDAVLTGVPRGTPELTVP